jgi:2-aminobenzoate-CoA ligase
MLPPESLWPVFDYSAPHVAGIPDRVNAVSELIDRAIDQGHGPRPAYHYLESTWTFDDLKDRVDRVARVMVDDYGLVPGNRVLLRARNTPMLVACWLGVIKAGGIVVGTMPLLRAKELDFILDRVKVRFVLCEQALADEIEAARTNAASLERVAYFTPLGDSGQADFDVSVAAAPAGHFAALATAADDIALVTFTSGSTGRPKAVAHFHRDIIACSECLTQLYPKGPGDIACGSPSMAFTFGMATFLIYPVRFGGCVALPEANTPEKILAAIQRHRVTSLYAVPTMYRALLKQVDHHDISSLKFCGSAGEHLQPALFDAWRERTGLRIVNGIGATEFMAHFISENQAVERPGSVGKPVPGYTVRIIDEEGRELPPGKTGLVAVRGPTGCRYLDDPDHQRAFVRDGWNVTSDVFRMDEEGYFWFADRADDIIVSSGYNISPQEVERAIINHPDVAEVAVVGIPDEQRGKLVRACIVLRDELEGDDEMTRSIQEFVKHAIAPYKYPRDIVYFDELPKTATGKIQRYKLREVARGSSE